jgi:SAM-dependent methyltransferase
MDRLDSSLQDLNATLARFPVINTVLTASRPLIRRHLLRDMTKTPAALHRVLDLGAGGGDLARWLVRTARRKGLRLHVLCLDHDPRVAAFARRACRGYPEIQVVCDGADGLARYGPFDYVFSNHFLHHLDDEGVRRIVTQVHESTRRSYLLNDLRRSRWSYVGFALTASLFVRGGFAREDGLISIARGFLPHEMRATAARVHPGVRVGACPPGRVFFYGRNHGARTDSTTAAVSASGPIS